MLGTMLHAASSWVWRPSCSTWWCRAWWPPAALEQIADTARPWCWTPTRASTANWALPGAGDHAHRGAGPGRWAWAWASCWACSWRRLYARRLPLSGLRRTRSGAVGAGGGGPGADGADRGAGQRSTPSCATVRLTPSRGACAHPRPWHFRRTLHGAAGHHHACPPWMRMVLAADGAPALAHGCFAITGVAASSVRRSSCWATSSRDCHRLHRRRASSRWRCATTWRVWTLQSRWTNAAVLEPAAPAGRQGGASPPRFVNLVKLRERPPAASACPPIRALCHRVLQLYRVVGSL